jgi:hypothetical protein
MYGVPEEAVRIDKAEIDDDDVMHINAAIRRTPSEYISVIFTTGDE